MEKRVKTQTSDFGTSGRVAHDSSGFYERSMFSEFEIKEESDYEENPIPKEYLNKVLVKSSENMAELPDNSVHLMVTSPPYNVGKEYDKDLTFSEYREFLRRVWKELYRVLVPGGRACINVANLGRKPYIPLHAFIIQDMLDIGFFMRGEIIWVKKGGGAPSTAWGTWMSAKNPVLRDEHEYILVFSKGSLSRQEIEDRKSTLTREEFLEYTKSVWYMPAESAKKVGHPAPFPVELPLRLIKLYTFSKEIVLDPFMGSGTTAIASVRSGRLFVGYEIDPEYAKIAERRIQQEVKPLYV